MNLFAVYNYNKSQQQNGSIVLMHFLSLIIGFLFGQAQQEVIQLELMCKQMYEGENSARSEAEKVLVAFQNSLDALPKCQMLLDRGQSSYSQLLAATTLTKLIAKNAQGLSLQEIVDIRNYILNYLATRPNLENFVIQALVTVLAKITKYGWFYCHKDEMVFRNIIEDVRKFLQVSGVCHLEVIAT